MYIYNQFVNPPKDWEIPVDDIFIGPRIGAGSFGTVYKVRRDTWGGGVLCNFKSLLRIRIRVLRIRIQFKFEHGSGSSLFLYLI